MASAVKNRTSDVEQSNITKWDVDDFLNNAVGEFTEEEAKEIIERIKSTGNSVGEFFYRKIKDTRERRIIMPKYNLVLKYIMPHVEYINFRYVELNAFEIVIKRKGWDTEFVWRVFYSDYEGMRWWWREKFDFMLRKNAVVDACKIVFADILSPIMFGYATEEVSNEDEMEDKNKNKNGASNKAADSSNLSNHTPAVQPIKQDTKENVSDVSTAIDELYETHYKDKISKERFIVLANKVSKAKYEKEVNALHPNEYSTLVEYINQYINKLLGIG
jgi:hypothetical protein